MEQPRNTLTTRNGNRQWEMSAKQVTYYNPLRPAGARSIAPLELLIFQAERCSALRFIRDFS
jgi:hypothetical protein